jgi:hypothetical protein
VTEARLAGRFPHGRYGWCWIDVNGARADNADMLDVEVGDASPATANLWVRSWHTLKRSELPVVYCNRGNEQQVIAACKTGGSVLGKDYGLCVATLDGTQVTGTGIVACQWKGEQQTGGHWGETLVYDGALWQPTAPPANWTYGPPLNLHAAGGQGCVAHVVAAGPGGTRVRPDTYAAVEFKTG